MKSPSRVAAAVVAGLAVDPSPAMAEGDPVPAAARSVDPCAFFRQRMRGHGLDHWWVEVVWACQEVTRRRAAGMAMSDRLLAVEFALARFREAVSRDRAERVARPGPRGESFRAEQAAAVERLAEETGMLAALEGIRQGF
jgi:hypothetical protein